MHVAAYKTGVLSALLLIISCALALTAPARDKGSARQIGSSVTVRANGRVVSSAPAFRVLCPCPDGPSRVVTVRRRRMHAHLAR